MHTAKCITPIFYSKVTIKRFKIQRIHSNYLTMIFKLIVFCFLFALIEGKEIALNHIVYDDVAPNLQK